MSRRNILRFVFPVIAALCFSGCGFAGPTNSDGLPVSALAATARGTGAFNGVWNLKLVPTKDTCKLGLGKSLATSVAIAQNGKKVTLALQGLPKYKGTVNGNRMSASGTYKVDTTRIGGTINATLASKKKLKIQSSKITVKSGSISCYIQFSGSGTKA